MYRSLTPFDSDTRDNPRAAHDRLRRDNIVSPMPNRNFRTFPSNKGALRALILENTLSRSPFGRGAKQRTVAKKTCILRVRSLQGYPFRGVAQSGSASALGAESRRFKSYRPDFFAPIAQLDRATAF